MAKIREKVRFAKVFLINPTNRSFLDEKFPELAYSQEEWTIQGKLLEYTLDILTKKLEPYSKPVTWCFIPHHMIVFYDGKGGRLGHVKICFRCTNYRAYPGRTNEGNSTEHFRKILDEIGVFISDDHANRNAYLVYFENQKLRNLLFDGHKVEIPEGIVETSTE